MGMYNFLFDVKFADLRKLTDSDRYPSQRSLRAFDIERQGFQKDLSMDVPFRRGDMLVILYPKLF